MGDEEEITGYDIAKKAKGELPLGSVYSLLGRMKKKNIVSFRMETSQKQVGIQKVFYSKPFDSSRECHGKVITVFKLL